MKKWLLWLSVSLAFMLAACSDDANAPAEQAQENEEPQEEREEAEEELTAEDVLEQSVEAAQNLESAEVSMDITQEMEAPEQEVSFLMQTQTDAQIITDPLTMYQTGAVTLEAEGETDEQELELYLVDDVIYMNDAVSGEWLKMDTSAFPVDQLEPQSPVEQLEIMQRFTNNMEMEETEDQYVLKITGDGDELMDFTREIMEEYMDEELMNQLEQEEIDIFENMSIQNVYYELFIDKESFETTALNLDMEMSIEAEGESLDIVQSVTSEYTGINSVDSIEVPQEVKDEAIDIMNELENMEEIEDLPVE